MSGRFDRRRFLAALGAGVATGAWGHADFGPVAPPRLAPRVPLVCGDRSRVTLDRLLLGRLSAVQLMFTGCSSVCPIQGALFAAAQARWIEARGAAVQFVSLSVDPLADDPAALAAWLKKQRALPGWIAAAPHPEALEAMRGFFRDAGSKDDHSTQVYLFDAQARLVWRTEPLPTTAAILGALRHFSAKA